MKIKNKKRFKGEIALYYKLIKYAYPDYPIFRGKILETIKNYNSNSTSKIEIVEIGCGYGAITDYILKSRSDLNLVAIDNEIQMIEQAKSYLKDWEGPTQFSIKEADALFYLKSLKNESVDIIVSELTFHNFNKNYRNLLLTEIYRVLVKGGVIVNSDKYSAHGIKRLLSFLYEEKCFYQLLVPKRKIKIFMKWILHHIADQFPSRIMKLKKSAKEMKRLGFDELKIIYSGRIISVLYARKLH